MGASPNKPTDFFVEMKGEKSSDVVTPQTVDGAALLQIAAGYVDFMQALARGEGEELAFTGIEIRSGSVCVASNPSSTRLAREYADRTAGYLEGVEEPPRGLESRTHNLGLAVKAAGLGKLIYVNVAGWRRPVRIPETKAPEVFWELTSFRATPIRAGGKEPRVRFESVTDGEFSLRADAEIARKLGGLLYQEVEVTANVLRDADGAIRAGRVEDAIPLAEGDPIAAWREWLQQAAPRWADVDDIEKELGRRDE